LAIFPTGLLMPLWIKKRSTKIIDCDKRFY